MVVPMEYIGLLYTARLFDSSVLPDYQKFIMAALVLLACRGAHRLPRVASMCWSVCWRRCKRWYKRVYSVAH